MEKRVGTYPPTLESPPRDGLSRGNHYQPLPCHHCTNDNYIRFDCV